MVAATEGTVTAAPGIGAVLDNGDVVFEVDDRPVRAMVADAPLWRTLAQGARGPDVQRLEEYLAATGQFTRTPDDRFDWNTLVAVRAFAAESGRPRNAAAFDPAWVSWVGPAPLSVAEVIAPVGTVITLGDAVARGPEAVEAIRVIEPAGGLSPEFGSSAQLQVGATEVPYQVHSAIVINPSDVVAIAAAMAPAEEGLATVRAAVGTEVSVVPASAVVTGPSGAICIYPDNVSSPVVVNPVGGGGATVQIPATADLVTVLANPNLFDGLPVCL